MWVSAHTAQTAEDAVGEFSGVPEGRDLTNSLLDQGRRSAGMEDVQIDPLQFFNTLFGSYGTVHGPRPCVTRLDF